LNELANPYKDPIFDESSLKATPYVAALYAYIHTFEEY
jgi:hypothetical protein